MFGDLNRWSRNYKIPFCVVRSRIGALYDGQAGIQFFQPFRHELDSSFHRSDYFLRDHQNRKSGKKFWSIKIDETVKSQKTPLLSFRWKPEPSHFNNFWTPAWSSSRTPIRDQVTELGLFTDHQNWSNRCRMSTGHEILRSQAHLTGGSDSFPQSHPLYRLQPFPYPIS